MGESGRDAVREGEGRQQGCVRRNGGREEG